MRKPIFLSALAKNLYNFIAFQHLGGADYNTGARDLSYFDRFLCQVNFQGQWPTQEVIKRYFSCLEHLHPNTRRHRLSVVRQFCLYLHQSEPQCYVPERRLPIRQIPPRVPHIFTEQEMKNLLTAALTLPPTGSLRPRTYYTLFGLLYTTGLRIGEAIGLDLLDADIEKHLLSVRKSKFGKSRWVPLSPSTSLALKRYLEERIRAHPVTPEAPFFVNSNGNRLHHQNVDKTFRTLLSQCGLRGGKGCAGPRIHDLRHSFACNRLLLWYRQGEDVNTLLPVLATYLGHKEISFTQVYLRATAELLEQANQRFLANFRQNVLPKGERR